jgi:hypothetical protein
VVYDLGNRGFWVDENPEEALEETPSKISTSRP